MKKLTEHQIEKAATEIINYLNKKSGWRGFIEGALWMQDLALPQADVIKSVCVLCNCGADFIVTEGNILPCKKCRENATQTVL